MQECKTTETRREATIVDQQQSRVQRVFRTTKIIQAGYLGVGLALLLTDVALAVSGHPDAVNSFMWGRSGGVVGSGVVFLWLTDAAARGRLSAYRRLQITSIAVPVIIAGLMLIPGVAPLWFKIAQIGSAVCVAATAFLINAPHVRRTFQ